MNLHMVQFVLSILLAGLFMIFMLRPFLAEIGAETKRIAELLAQLPADIDVEGLVQKALLPPKSYAALKGRYADLQVLRMTAVIKWHLKPLCIVLCCLMGCVKSRVCHAANTLSAIVFAMQVHCKMHAV